MLRGEPWGGSHWKGQKRDGAPVEPVQVERIKKSIRRGKDEDNAKAAAKRRDSNRCRWPHGTPAEREICRRIRKEAAHFEGKGIGGKHAAANARANLITLCAPTHQGPGSIHDKKKRVVALTKDLMDGPCAFEEKKAGKWVRVGLEVHVGVLA